MQVLTVEGAKLGFHLRHGGEALRSEMREIAAGSIDFGTKSLRVHSMSEVEIGRNLKRFTGAEIAGTNRVTPAAVSNGGAHEVQLRTQAIGVDLIDQHRDVNTRIRFAGDVELVLLELREGGEEVDQKLVGVLSGRFVSVDTLRRGSNIFTVRESNTLRGLEVQHVGVLSPCVRIEEYLRHTVNGVGQGIVVGHNLTIFGQQANQRRGTRSTVQPQNHGVAAGVVGGFNEPVVKLTFHSRQIASGDVCISVNNFHHKYFNKGTFYE